MSTTVLLQPDSSIEEIVSALTTSLTDHLDQADVTDTRVRLDVDLALEPRHGDFLVGYRRSRYQRGMTLYGDPCTHIAMVCRTGSELRTLEMGPKGGFSRSIDEFHAKYLWVGLLRPQIETSCLHAVVASAERSVAEQNLEYSKALCVIVGLTGFFRRVLPRRLERLVNCVALACTRRLHRRTGGTAMSCSSFLALHMQAACPACRLQPEVNVRELNRPFVAAPSALDAKRGPVRPAKARDADAALAMMSPSDLWVAVPASFKMIEWTGPAGSRRPSTLLVNLPARLPAPAAARGGDAMNPNPGCNPNPNP